jgi:hypothetical protein
MFKIFFVVLFLSSQSFAATLLISKRVVSGFVQPEHTFIKDCRIYKNGDVQTSMVIGQSAPIREYNHISRAKILLINIYLELAKKGQIVDTGAICDAGSHVVEGFVKGQKVLLDENLDCGSHKENQSKAVPKLIKWSEKICGF